jgi:hypothetical protein
LAKRTAAAALDDVGLERRHRKGARR